MTNAFKTLFPVNLQYFAEGDPQATDPQTEPAGDDSQSAQEPAKTFTQEELEKKIAERLARDRKKYADYDDLRRKVEEYETAEAERKKAEMTAQERLEAEKAEAMRKAQEAEEAAQRTMSTANQRLIKSEFKLLAKEAGIRADALEDAYKLADLSGVAVDDDGNVDGVKAVIDALITGKPYLVEQAKKEPKTIGGPSGYSNDDVAKTLEAQLEEAKKQRNFSKVVELSNKIQALLKK